VLGALAIAPSLCLRRKLTLETLSIVGRHIWAALGQADQHRLKTGEMSGAQVLVVVRAGRLVSQSRALACLVAVPRSLHSRHV
jgi:phage terminase Nu1 subunit (DNA packaging protein)